MSNSDRMSSFNQAVGTWLKNARLACGLSLAEAAAQIEGSVQQISDIEAGRSSLAGTDFYTLIAAYHVPSSIVTEFLEEFGLAPSPSS